MKLLTVAFLSSVLLLSVPAYAVDTPTPSPTPSSGHAEKTLCYSINLSSFRRSLKALIQAQLNADTTITRARASVRTRVLSPVEVTVTPADLIAGIAFTIDPANKNAVTLTGDLTGGTCVAKAEVTVFTAYRKENKRTVSPKNKFVLNVPGVIRYKIVRLS